MTRKLDLAKVDAALKRAGEVAATGSREARSGAILGDAKKRMAAAALAQDSAKRRK
jgi:hypothetical protein